MSRLVNQQDLEFLLFDMFSAGALQHFPRYADYDTETIHSMLSTAQGLAEDYFLPHFQKADAQEPQFDGETVTTIPELKQAWQQFADAGFLAARQSHEQGGLQMPALVNMACQSYFMAANPATAAYPFLTSAAANVIQAFGSREQQQRYLPAMFSGRFAGTMALTEPAVGSSLGDLTTKATAASDGTYRIKGQKMYISGGDQDLTENIVHLVLARIEGAPIGVKGISMFIVPKFLVHEDGSLGARNDVALAGLLHKMGYRGTTSTVLNFGEQDQCVGYLVGEPNRGLEYMFKMMNEARIGVGLGAAMIGYRGYLESLAYAKERPQGRAPDNKDPSTAAIPIIEHADVKRMLISQKAYVEGSLALCLLAARLVDEDEAGGDADAAILLDLLTPIVKSYPSYYGPRANDLAIQVLGGSGYIREYPVEQCYRDNRLNPIHEGTHGIQGLDLLGRKLWQQQGKGQKLLLRRIHKTLAEVRTIPELAPLAERYEQALQPLLQHILAAGERLQAGEIKPTLAQASVFLDVMGTYVVAWLWLDMARLAKVKAEQDDSFNDFAQGKVAAAKHFMQWELTQAESALASLNQFASGWDQIAPEWL